MCSLHENCQFESTREFFSLEFIVSEIFRCFESTLETSCKSRWSSTPVTSQLSSHTDTLPKACASVTLLLYLSFTYAEERYERCERAKEKGRWSETEKDSLRYSSPATRSTDTNLLMLLQRTTALRYSSRFIDFHCDLSPSSIAISIKKIINHVPSRFSY